jgi:hypothetical protein
LNANKANPNDDEIMGVGNWGNRNAAWRADRQMQESGKSLSGLDLDRCFLLQLANAGKG